MKELLKFLESQKSISIFCYDEKEIWIANVFFGSDESANFYFISPQNTKHSEIILKNPNVAFAHTWFDSNNHKNRKGIQATGICQIATSIEGIAKGVEIYNKNFPEFKEKININWITDDDNESKVWIIKPKIIKYWDDIAFGEGNSQEFTY
jgi:uncharacterized protein YhbP (UPF0306 family)